MESNSYFIEVEHYSFENSGLIQCEKITKLDLQAYK